MNIKGLCFLRKLLVNLNFKFSSHGKKGLAVLG
jgi:hypothetical protein